MAKIEIKSAATKKFPSLKIRTAEVEDAQKILDVVAVIMKTSHHLLTSPEEFNFTVEQETQIIKSHLDHPDKLMIIPEIDEKIIGMLNFSCGGRLRNRHQGEFGMSIHPDYQAKGIGKILLQELIVWAKQNPRLETLRLKVHSKNLAAISLYESCGFTEEGKEIRAIKLPNGSYDDVFGMALSVTK